MKQIITLFFCLHVLVFTFANITYSFAQEHNSAATKESTNEAQKYYQKGLDSYYKDKSVDQAQAIDFFNTAISLNQNYAEAYERLCAIYNSKGLKRGPEGLEDLEKALAYCEKALQINPGLSGLKESTGSVHNNIGFNLHYYEKRNLYSANKHYAKAVSYDPSHSSYYTSLASSYISQDLHMKAIETYKEALTVIKNLKPYEISSLYWNMGYTYTITSQFSEAIVCYNKANAAKPSYQAYCYLGKAYNMKTEWDLAADSYQKALKLDPEGFASSCNAQELLDEVKRDIERYRK